MFQLVVGSSVASALVSGCLTALYSMMFLNSYEAGADMRSDMNKPVKVIINSVDAKVMSRVQEALADQPIELICDPVDCAQAPFCRWLVPQPINECGQLAGAIQDAIATLEQTRHAFRSSQLGGLRRRLEKLLQELPEAGN